MKLQKLFEKIIPDITKFIPAILTIWFDIKNSFKNIKKRAKTRRTPNEFKKHILDTYSSTRIGLGIIGILYPLILWFIGLLLGIELQGSISAYYHTDMRNVFVGVLFIVGASLYLYKGYSSTEDYVLDGAGLCAVGIAIFPTSCVADSVCDTFTAPWLHGISALVFFFLIAYICIFKSSDTLENKQVKQAINIEHYKEIYKWLGIGMIGLPVVAAVLLNLKNETESLVFWVEFVAIWVFSIYWIVKTVEINTSQLEEDV
jgi:hypothetical protein